MMFVFRSTRFSGRLGTTFLALGIVGLLAVVACRPPSEEAVKSRVESAVDQAGSDEFVGYDLRRLRPRDQPLAEMFRSKAEQARGEGKRVAVLFSADWCSSCRRIDTELGNTHPSSMIGDVRILELKQEEWKEATRMAEFNRLRSRWSPTINKYPLFVVLDSENLLVEEMKAGKVRLEAEGLDPDFPMWFESTRNKPGLSQPSGIVVLPGSP